MKKSLRFLSILAVVIISGLLVRCSQSTQTGPGKNPGGDSDKTSLDLGDGARLELVSIPAGSFTMGSPESEEGRLDTETEHDVTIGLAFQMGKYPVTVGQFQAFVKATGYKTDAEKGGKVETVDSKEEQEKSKECWQKVFFTQADNHPVVCVSWNDAQAFCEWLSKKTGKTVRLPTEAEWEYACRAETGTMFSFGDSGDELFKYANYCDKSSTNKLKEEWQDKDHDDGHDKTAPVGSYKPNAWGLYDMHGNVMQWCQDRYGKYPEGEVLDPRGPEKGDSRVLRGGHWNTSRLGCRAAFRCWIKPTESITILGFRVAVGPLGTGTAQQKQATVYKEWPFSSEEAKKRQKETADALSLPVEKSIDLGGGVKLDLVLVPPGRFLMGSPTDEKDRTTSEFDMKEIETQHEVTLTKPFYIGKYEVTCEVVETVMGMKPGEYGVAKEPAKRFSPKACRILMDKLRSLVKSSEGRFRLPTEAEWEYACRAGTATRFYTGDSDSDLDKAGWYGGNSDKKLHPVGQKAPNAWGLYDMHGNVEEFVEDCFGEYPKEAATNPKGPPGFAFSVLRSGSCSDESKFCRSANRRPVIYDYQFGSFRLVLVPRPVVGK